MRATRNFLEDVIFGKGDRQRFTQDSPVLPDVWIEFGTHPSEKIDLLLRPHRDTQPGAIARTLRERLDADKGRKKSEQHAEIAYSQSTVAVHADLEEFVRHILPLSGWWWTHVVRDLGVFLDNKSRKRALTALEDGVKNWTPLASSDACWLVRIVGVLALTADGRGAELQRLPPAADVLDAARQILSGTPRTPNDEARLWSVHLNRAALPSIWRSTGAIKADAATRLFGINCSELTWAVIDSGIDATHPAFRLRDKNNKPFAKSFEKKNGKVVNNTRVVKTYDFTVIRGLLNPRKHGELQKAMTKEKQAALEHLRDRLERKAPIDWALVEPLIRVPDDKYKAPLNDHGTHVAGIIGADWRKGELGQTEDYDIAGVCPDIRLYDLRVLDEEGKGDEFSILAALEFLRHVNGHGERLVVQGANVSMSIRHDVVNYACGRTPVCEEADHLVSAGICVVAAAGNLGYSQFLTTRSEPTDTYRSISITDPGNAATVITVGATHRYRPHTYGVSYFSSRGPTADGRIKPDLVAPGEKIKSCVLGGYLDSKDGTSMAAPHVSGAAAMLMARHRELVGEPARIKQILCQTATDLGRERYFQGAGMLDVLRALQAL